MKRKQPDWLNYWNSNDDLDYLLHAQDNIDEVYSDIRNSLGRALMSEEMLELQEALEERIEILEKKMGHQAAA
ncbi:hypothetical protein JW960_20615 [candidate division KSB1 bacterium]|nr:hypothetical protein [candidate division KSB1 bacterium]